MFILKGSVKRIPFSTEWCERHSAHSYEADHLFLVHWHLQKSGKLWSHANQLSFYPLKFWVPQSQFSVETFKQPARLNRVRPLFWQTFSNQKSYSTTHTRLSLHFNLRATTEDCVIAGDTVTAVSVTVEFLLFVFICHSLQSPKRAVQNAQIVSEEK